MNERRRNEREMMRCVRLRILVYTQQKFEKEEAKCSM